MQYYRVKGKYGGKIRPKTGRPLMFSIEMEEDLALFMKHCDLLRIPKTCNDLTADIVHYVSYHNLKVKRMADDGPGEWKTAEMYGMYHTPGVCALVFVPTSVCLMNEFQCERSDFSFPKQ